MKATRKLIPALAMLIVSAVVMSSASFAWFTMSREVTATGIDVSVTAPDNLLIKGNDEGDDWSSAEDTKVAATLVPASTAAAGDTAAKTFYSVVDGVDGLVKADDGSLFATTKLKSVTSSAVNNGTGSFVDYVFKIKTDGETTNVYVKDFAITDKNDSADNSDTYLKPVRFALLTGTTADTLVGQYNAGEGTNLGDNKTEHVIASNAVVKSLTSDNIAEFEAASYIAKGTTTTKFEVATGTETTITIRVWYEGQDDCCTIAKAKGAKFELKVTLAAVNG